MQAVSDVLAATAQSRGQKVTELKFLEASLGALDARKVARLVASTVDLTFVIDAQGHIQQAVALDPQLAKLAQDHWQGRTWADSVTVESRSKVRELIAEANADAPTRWREINLRYGSDEEIPVRFSAVKFEEDGLIVAMGYDLQPVAQLQQKLVNAQRELERDFQKLREVETRYRVLFQITAEAVLIVDGQSLRTIDSNPAAAMILETTPGRLVGRNVYDLVSGDSREALQSLLAGVRASGRTEAVRVHVESANKPFLASCAAIRADDGIAFMLRFAPVDTGALTAKPSLASAAALSALPDGFILAGSDRRIVDVNDAFLDLARLGHRNEVIGSTLDQWLGRTAVEGNVLLAHLKDHGRVRGFALALRGGHNTVEDVDVSAVTLQAAGETYYGFLLRRLKRQETGGAQALARSPDDFADLVGRLSLKGIVRETTDVIEKLCIEAALRLTGDNRAAAAEMLGLSRQSLYSKMHRHGIGNLDPHEMVD
jgi:transcriptional regulator PpsR